MTDDQAVKDVKREHLKGMTKMNDRAKGLGVHDRTDAAEDPPAARRGGNRPLVPTGSTLKARSVEEKIALAHALQKEIRPLLNQGKLRPILHQAFPL